MKVLWFSNTPANGSEILKEYGVRGGWLSSLDQALNGKVELIVAFNHPRFVDPFNHKGVRYIPICKKNWKLNIIKKTLFGDSLKGKDSSIYIDIINKVQPDLIHIHGSESPFTSILGKTDVPVVLSYQGSCTVYNHKYFSGIEKKYASKSGVKLFSPYSWLFSKSYNKRFKYSSRSRKKELRDLKFLKNIIGRTDWDRRITRFIAPQSQYFHNDEVLREPFYKNTWEKSNSQKIIIHSTIGEAFFKGYETVCHSINELNKIGLDIEWRIAGIPTGCLLDKVVKRKLKENYPDKGLILLGSLNENELIGKMLESDIYVMPSHIENSPNSLCEAMVMGMPCITTLAGGTSSLLKDKEEGIVIQDGDPWSMAGAILDLHQDPERASIYGQNAKKAALKRHNPEKIANELLLIYKQCITK